MLELQKLGSYKSGKTQPNQKLEERVSALIQQNSGTISHMRSKMPAQLALPEMQ